MMKSRGGRAKLSEASILRPRTHLTMDYGMSRMALLCYVLAAEEAFPPSIVGHAGQETSLGGDHDPARFAFARATT